MPTKKVLTGPIKTRKARNKTAAPRRTTGSLRPATTSRLPSPEMRVTYATDEATIKAEDVALAELWEAVKDAGDPDNVTVTRMAKEAKNRIAWLSQRLQETDEDLEAAEAAREAAERALEDEIATGEEGAQQYAWSRE